MDKRRIYLVVGTALTWGLIESGLGPVLKTTCSSGVTGSVLCGLSFFFLAAVYEIWRKPYALLAVLGIVVGLKIASGILLGLPLMGGAIGNPIFAYITETVFFVIVIAFIGNASPVKRSAVGAASAGLAVLSFPLVVFCTGTPACMMAGMPLAYYYAYVAVGIAAVSAPLGFRAGRRVSDACLEPLPVRRRG